LLACVAHTLYDKVPGNSGAKVRTLLACIDKGLVAIEAVAGLYALSAGTVAVLLAILLHQVPTIALAFKGFCWVAKLFTVAGTRFAHGESDICRSIYLFRTNPIGNLATSKIFAAKVA